MNEKLRARRVKALAISDAPMNVSAAREFGQTVSLLGRELSFEAWHVVKVYSSPGWADAIWPGSACSTKRGAVNLAAKLNAAEKEEHRTHPWWGPYETHGSRFVVRFGICTGCADASAP